MGHFLDMHMYVVSHLQGGRDVHVQVEKMSHDTILL